MKPTDVSARPAADTPDNRPADSSVPATPTVPGMRLPRGRWTALEIVFWLLPIAGYFLFPDYLVLISQIMIVGLFGRR